MTERAAPSQRAQAGAREFSPLPETVPQAASRRRRTRRHRRWYQRKRVVFPLVALAALLVLAGASAWYIKGRFDALQELSTPPPEVSGSRLGGDDALVIDTGPAQEAVKNAEAQRASGGSDVGTTDVAVVTAKPLHGVAGGGQAALASAAFVQVGVGGTRRARA